MIILYTIFYDSSMKIFIQFSGLADF